MAKTAARKQKPAPKKKPAARAKSTPPRAAASAVKRKPPARSAPPAKPAKPTKSARHQWVYTFGDGKAEGKAAMRDLLGGKGANLAEMANLGLPVPPGFTISTEVCTYYYGHDSNYPPELKTEVEAALQHVGKLAGKTFGDPDNPLLVLEKFFGFFPGVKIKVRLADGGFGVFHAQTFGERLAKLDESGLGVLEINPIRHIVQDGLQQPVGAGHAFFRSLQFRDVPADTHQAYNRMLLVPQRHFRRL